MPDVIMVLQLDHRRMSRLLGFIQQQVANMIRRAPVNYWLLESAFEYLSAYPEKCHHPKEDAVYHKLLARCPGAAEALRELDKEHQKLSGLTLKLREAICASRLSRPAVNDELADQLWSFLDYYRLHMLMEENLFFPMALENLTRDDFAEIDYTLFDQPDPLFNQVAEERFAALRDEITRIGVAEQGRTSERVEAASLASFHDIAAFNAAMKRAGEPVHLTRLTSGGYELDRSGQTLVHIPACSESRAAWCAYFFWKATTMNDSVAAGDVLSGG